MGGWCERGVERGRCALVCGRWWLELKCGAQTFILFFFVVFVPDDGTWGEQRFGGSAMEWWGRLGEDELEGVARRWRWRWRRWWRRCAAESTAGR